MPAEVHLLAAVTALHGGRAQQSSRGGTHNRVLLAAPHCARALDRTTLFVVEEPGHGGAARYRILALQSTAACRAGLGLARRRILSRENSRFLSLPTPAEEYQVHYLTGGSRLTWKLPPEVIPDVRDERASPYLCRVRTGVATGGGGIPASLSFLDFVPSEVSLSAWNLPDPLHLGRSLAWC